MPHICRSFIAADVGKQNFGVSVFDIDIYGVLRY
jgi:hypothetical protein